MMRLIIFSCLLILILCDVDAYAVLSKAGNCYFEGAIKVIGANAYYAPVGSDISGYSYFPAKLFPEKMFPIFINCGVFARTEEAAGIKPFSVFHDLTISQRSAQGYNLIYQTRLLSLSAEGKKSDFSVSRYIAYKSRFLHKKVLGSCDLFFEWQGNRLSMYIKSNNPNQLACYFDKPDNSIVIKAV